MYLKQYREEKIKGWGGHPIVSANVFRPERIGDLIEFINRVKGTFLARGGGTSYGDASINNDGINIDMHRLNKMLHFDPDSGVLHCQSGVALRDIIKTFLQKGWFLHVTPGTQFATVGGCVACDAHGKNWKAGSFRNCVKGFSLMLYDGSIVYCSDNENSDMFLATVGGMGMTGIILDVHLQLKKVSSSYMDVETIRFSNLSELFNLQCASMDSHEYLFAWLDSQKEGKSMGRGILQRANHCADGNLQYKEKRRISVPFYMLNCTVNKFSVAAFNNMYYAMAAKNKESKLYFSDFFYPLDRFTNWYKIYGKKGLVEYQVAVPLDGAYDTISELFGKITKSKLGSTVAAVKPLIKSDGLMSFPIDGFTLAVDFAYSEKLWSFLDKLDRIVIASGGRVYLAKDARLSAKSFKEMYSNSLEEWELTREKYHVKNGFKSIMFNRFLNS
ncbi:MAG: FAD-binding oxidoreductase [Chloroflexota bacterium]